MERYSHYKESGIQWIGEIPSHWKICSVRTYAQEYVEKNKPEKTRELLALSYALGVTLYRDKQFNMDRVKENYEEYKIVHEGVLVVSPNDIIKGSVFVSQYYGCISPMYITLKSRFSDPDYLLYLSYLLRSKKAGRKFFSLAKGLIGSILDNGKYVTRRMSVSRNDLMSFKVILPPLSELQTIVEFLDKKTSQIDTIVADKEKEIELLQELKQKTIADAVTKGLNPDAKMKDSGISWIGEIPEHWEVKKIGSLFVERREKVSDKDYPALSVSKQGITPQLDTAVKTDNGDNRKKVCKNDFVVNSRSDRKGSCGVSPYTGSVSLINIVLSPRKNIEVQYFHHLFRSNNYIEEYYRIGRGIVADLWTTRYSEMRNIFVPLPPKDEQQAIVSYIEEKCEKIDKLASELQSEIDYLKEYKQRLIADCVTGQVKVS